MVQQMVNKSSTACRQAGKPTTWADIKRWADMLAAWSVPVSNNRTEHIGQLSLPHPKHITGGICGGAAQ